jgi:hypothetical protein
LFNKFETEPILGLLTLKKILIMFVYDTVTEAVRGLKQRGYTKDFNLRENCIVCNDEKFHPEDFEIVEVYRFEGESDPADEAVVYAISSNKGERGVLVSGYGISADEMSTEMAKKLSMHLHND